MQKTPHTFISPTLNDILCPHTHYNINVAPTEMDVASFCPSESNPEKKQGRFIFTAFPISFPGSPHCSAPPRSYHWCNISQQLPQVLRPFEPKNCSESETFNMERILTTIFTFSPDQAVAIVSTSEEMIHLCENNQNIMEVLQFLHTLKHFLSNGIK